MDSGKKRRKVRGETQRPISGVGLTQMTDDGGVDNDGEQQKWAGLGFIIIIIFYFLR